MDVITFPEKSVNNLWFIDFICMELFHSSHMKKAAKGQISMHKLSLPKVFPAHTHKECSG